ncbi:hypothetical protein AVEN_131067-1 [Araneus ventricosus]|uniref:Uncharacterized protein n=1 Tax=Araneus ventricosus TaxID=182803 RepID=A0A4Y2D2J5_ARAVE|nr:hypothetical protein AVEN_131067-1 [Araneus ventricosus]
MSGQGDLKMMYKDGNKSTSTLGHQQGEWFIHCGMFTERMLMMGIFKNMIHDSSVSSLIYFVCGVYSKKTAENYNVLMEVPDAEIVKLPMIIGNFQQFLTGKPYAK